MTSRDSTRRDAVRLAGGALLTVAGLAAVARPALAQEEEDDPTILDRLIRIEQRGAVLYETLIARGLVDGDLRSSAELLRDQDGEHVDALTTALGTDAPAPPAADSVGRLRGRADALDLAIDLETDTLAAYYDAAQKLRDPNVLKTAASIMGNHGQHLVVLRQAAGRPRLVNAFETGEG